MKPRVGHIRFLNSMPLYEGMRITGLLDLIELVKGTPRELIDMLRRGELEVSPISSVEYCKGGDDLLVIPEISITAYESVESVVLVSKVPIDELDKRRISLSNASSTSQTLLKVILREYHDIYPEYIEMEPDLQKMLEVSDAALLIGDPALIAFWREDELFKYDLSHEWYRHTGMGMSYAIWVIREAYAECEHDQARWLVDGIKNAMRTGESAIEHTIDVISNNGYPQERLKRYFGKLSFGLSQKDVEGLLIFFKKAFDLGLVEKVPDIRFFGD
ncbi:MAG TPA: hypothetical protein ENI32_07770 [Candidatus Syntrophoarchaeum butanivorans]|uniref:Chorismate dehydratase n=1 Tax=Candidatus Syntropharchaeum butanivorans TaxID=1839936 RepID=A0A1F2P815_9EURY|nr:MAG: ABC transporter substrate-binding protein [Candidatus Syntrophoarchaeum butanivorans]HEC57748.1 hypothetical protein [Candidatus Syntrophoarchaeum butanivorans]